MQIAEISLHRLQLPLKAPYKLAFGPVLNLDTVLVTVTGGGGETGFGEATILTGYTPETIDTAWTIAHAIAEDAKGKDAEAAKNDALKRHHDAPFTVSALVTAIEMAEGSPYLDVREETPVPLLAILNATEEAEIEQEITRHIAAGYGTIKVKVGFDWQKDDRRLKFIQGVTTQIGGGRVKLRIDGNQGYGLDDALAFTRRLAPDHIELFEQPCHMDDWAAAKAVSDISPVAMMLDESIYGPKEIERAAREGSARFIKLKLMKAGSLQNLADQLSRIRELGMEPVLGNGVAADPGCWMEACVARSHISNAGEMNGFLKPKSLLFEMPMAMRGGDMILPATPPRLIGRDALTALAAATARIAA
ncbi:MAG: enolase C-terminal domain-like protein [Rhodospirillaceae bacterium]